VAPVEPGRAYQTWAGA